MDATRSTLALLVDDEPFSRSANHARLVDEGYDVVVAQTESEALSRAKQSAPKVIFTHLVASGPGNLRLIQALRSDDGCRHIPVVVITDRHDVRVAQRKLHAVPREG